jgi:hypothetical protein
LNMLRTMDREVVGVRPARFLWLGVGIFVAGRLIDLIWHATHPEFETAADQVQAHAVVWLGALIMIVAAAWGVRSGRAAAGHTVVLLGGLGYAVVAIWHFYEHAQLRDPDIAHVLLLVFNMVMFVGAVWVWLSLRRLRRETP